MSVDVFFIAAESSTTKNPDCGCQLLTFNDYTDMMWTTLAEFPGIHCQVFWGFNKTLTLVS